MKQLLAGLFLLAQIAHAQPVRITGRIVQPVPGAAVELRPFMEDRAESLRQLAGEAIPPLASVKPRADGSFELKAPEPGFYSVVVRAEGRLARKTFLTFVVEDSELPPVELPSTAPLRVRAVGPDGLPLAGVAIQALPVRPREDGWSADDRRAVTDADGRATFLRAEGEELRLTITTPGRYGVALTGSSGSEQTVAFPKPGARVVELHSPDGKPAAGVLVRIGNRGWPYGLTGEDGRLALPVPGDGEVVALAEDAKGRRIEIVMTVEAGEGTDVPVVALRPPTTLTGQVLEAGTREPLAGALVWNGGSGAKGWVRSDSRGGFELRAPSGDRGRVEAQAPGRLRHTRRWSRDDNQPVTFLLEPAGSIPGQVVDEAGRPLAGARLTTIPNPSSRADEIWMGPVVTWSGADGRFVLRSLPANRLHSVSASLDGLAPASQPADASSGPPIRLQLGRGATAVGRVVDEAGQPVIGAEVTLTPASLPSVPDAGTGRLQAVSDGEGRFRFPRVNAGSFGLQVTRGGFARAAPGEVTIPEKTAETDLGTITLTPGAVIEGIVVDGRGKPVAGADVDPESFDSRLFIRSVTTGPDGRFRFADLPRGSRFNLWIDHPGFVQLQMPEVSAPTPKPLRVKLVEARSLKGQVVDPEGQPVAGAKVALVQGAGGLLLGGGFSEGAWGSSLATTDADGRFVLDRLPPGTIGIGVRATGFRNRELPGVQIPEDGEATPVEIQLEPGPYLEGRVLDGQGRPVPRALVRAEGKVQDSGRFPFGGTRADDEGHYQINGLEPGTYTITAESQEGGPAARASVEIRVGPNRLDLALSAGTEVSGRVVDSHGLPVPGASVSLLGLPPTSTSWGGLQATSSADGFFLVRDVPEGVYRLTGQRRGFARSEAPETVEVGGDPVQGLELRLSPGAVIRGKILGLTPVDRGRIEVHASGETAIALSPAQVDADGSYRIPDLPPGRWTVLVLMRPLGVVAQESVEIGADDQEVVLDLQMPAPER
ncbi:MAG TPA: carboxypeptidase regulatory-like domain-containing protein [Thermoanaerobaculia bacterium]|jgi:protocatechuate 3,4-dioxygenase beta subunit|nr:carboxypeptidase regulatory-like domain-containing protein [Thermoanaerobaculia bacterium]